MWVVIREKICGGILNVCILSGVSKYMFFSFFVATTIIKFSLLRLFQLTTKIISLYSELWDEYLILWNPLFLLW